MAEFFSPDIIPTLYPFFLSRLKAIISLKLTLRDISPLASMYTQLSVQIPSKSVITNLIVFGSAIPMSYPFTLRNLSIIGSSLE